MKGLTLQDTPESQPAALARAVFFHRLQSCLLYTSIRDQVISTLGLKPNTFVGLTAGKTLAAQKTAGALIKLLPTLAPHHMDQARYEFCWITDFPMYEIGEESGQLEFCHNPFSMPKGQLEVCLLYTSRCV